MTASSFGNDTTSVLLANTIQTTSTPYLDLLSRNGALAAMPTLASTRDRIAAQLGEIGAWQSRLSIALNVSSVMAQEHKAAESRIRDADIAQESASLMRSQILQQVSAAILAQANQEGLMVMKSLSM